MSAFNAPIRCPSQSDADAIFVPFSADWLARVVAIEQVVHSHPWNANHFTDSLRSGYQIQLLVANQTVLGYLVAMQGVDEMHLLNLTVAPQYQRQGWAHIMLDALAIWSRAQSMEWLWLEVRASNQRALDVYIANGYEHMGIRKNYYPAPNGQREDAVVMCLKL